MININPPIILDNTVIGRFGLTNRFDLLVNRYGGQLIVPSNVIAEAIVIQQLETHLTNALTDKKIEEFALDFVKTTEEFKTYVKLRKRFDDGECAVLAIAKINECTVASDDMTATRKYCEDNRISHIGSLGILYDCFCNKLIDFAGADQLLIDMITITKYKCPVTKFEEVVNWFENGVGKRLY